jgi:hypothetical protein
MGFSEWMEHNWFRWLIKGGLAGAVSQFILKVGEWFFYGLPFPINIVFILVLGVGYGYVIEEIGLYGGE